MREHAPHSRRVGDGELRTLESSKPQQLADLGAINARPGGWCQFERHP
jgi:hypothetical protein